MNRLMARAGMAIASLIFVAGTAPAQDFQKAYQIPSGGNVRVSTVSGDVTVTGYDGGAIVVTGFKEGRDRDLVEIEDRSSGNNVDVRVRYPKQGRNDASVRFEVQVPRSVSYDFDGISSVSGEVQMRDVTGDIHANSVSGNVRVENVTGRVSASSVSGNVNVDVTRLEGISDMKFSSVSGNVTVRLPSDLSADIEMSTLSGSLKTDFPIEVREKRYGPGRSARGRVGEADKNLRLTSVSGNVTLKRLDQ
jgi:Toastrack DUF4097